ncbi:Mitochondrial ubiquitin ligase activator of NFKB 1 [Balamuthia mandrillaris]
MGEQQKDAYRSWVVLGERVTRARASGTLDLSGMGLESLPTGTALSSSSAASAEIIAQPRVVPLRVCFLQHNHLTELDAESFFAFSSAFFSPQQQRDSPTTATNEAAVASLQLLHLAHNRLSRLPKDPFFMGSFASLRSLNLTGNRLTALPPSIGRLGSLQDLFLGHNLLRQLPEELFLGCSALSRLYLTANPLVELPACVRVRAASLRVLELSGCGATLVRPPMEVVRMGLSAILAYFASLPEKGEGGGEDEEKQEEKEGGKSDDDTNHEEKKYNGAAQKKTKKKKKEKKKTRRRQRKAKLLEAKIDAEKQLHEERARRKKAERQALLLDVQKQKLRLDKKELQKKMVQLLRERKEARQSAQALSEELARQERKNVCVVCMDQSRSHLFLPCGHLATCHQCSLRLSLCPVCRTAIREMIQVFYA